MPKKPVQFLDLKLWMKNIKEYLLFFWQGWMWICTIAFTFAFFGLFLQFDFGTNFWEIDSCLDHGGSWHYTAEKCAYTNEEEAFLIEKHGPKKPD